MNRIDFSKNGGFPATQFMTNFMQSTYTDAFTALAGLIGDKVIVSGVLPIGSQVSNGWISYNGELLPFVGGPVAVGASVIINEVASSRVFDDGQSKDVYMTRVATIGSPGLFPFSDLVRLDQLKMIGVPVGSITLWGGLVAKIPDNYGLCDGSILSVTDYPKLFNALGNVHGGDGVANFALPNLKGSFVAGLNADDPDFATVGKTGGEKKHTLSVGELPELQFSVTIPSKDFSSQGNFGPNLTGPGDGAASTQTFSTNKLGGNQAHNILPPYYTLAYIIKLK